jgi:AraC-like DNA-binding protein
MAEDPEDDEIDAERIVETRRSALSPHESRRGILRPLAEGSMFRLERFQPQGDLRLFVDRFWSVRWDLRGREPHPQETLPHPCVNLAIEAGKSAIYGIGKRKFTAVLQGKGQVVGAKFRPGMFAPFVSVSATSLTGHVVPLRDLFKGAASLEREALRATSTADRVGALEAFLRERLPQRNEEAERAAYATELALADREITSVEGLADRCNASTSALQRLFRKWVGVGPKWVIRRARVQEAAERVAAGEHVNWAQLASELGYCDQTHLIKDFRAQVGLSPGAYAAACRSGDAARGSRSAARSRS